MSDQTDGLRFDVYERVHLPEDVAAIDELEEIELIPRIAVIDEGEQALLRGQLLLNGVYRGQEEQDGLLVLEHRIPVEISLPMSRVSRLDDISIDIDNFDVDILSARTLNITGVLSLKGLLVESLGEEENNWSEEVYTAVHERADEEVILYDRSSDEDEEAEAEYASDNEYDNEEDAEQKQEEEVEERPEEQLDEQWDNTAASDSGEEEWEQETVELAADDREEAAENWQTEEQAKWQSQWQAEEEERPQYTAVEQEASFEQLEDTAKETELSFANNEAVVPRDEAAPEKQSLQIAFNAKHVSESSEEQSGLGISSLLHSSKREIAARKAAVQSDIEAVDEEQERTEEQEDVEWKKIFLNKGPSDQVFKKIRLCIVQREETLEQIALRYSLNPREILQHNRLSEPSVSEGQIIYIP